MRSKPVALLALLVLGAALMSAAGSSRADDVKHQIGVDKRNGVSDVFYFATDAFAAIAYSPETGKYGYAHGYGTREISEQVALRNCKADDARIVASVLNGFCALAVGDDGAWGVGSSTLSGANNTAAKDRALAECKKRSPTARLLLCVCSVKRKPELFE
jgi:hypothetical protein